MTDAEGEATAVTWTAGWPPEFRRRLVLGTGIPALLVTLAGMFGPWVVDAPWLPNLIFVGGLWFLWSTVALGPTTFRVTDAGLVRDGRYRDRVTPWDRVSDVEVSDGALVVHRTGWRRPIRCDATAIDDLDAVTSAIETRRGAA